MENIEVIIKDPPLSFVGLTTKLNDIEMAKKSYKLLKKMEKFKKF